MEHQSDGISWLIDRIVTDPRTESIYRVDGTGATQLWVLTQDEHANAKVQYDYSGYLIESMDKFGFFDCDVILISNKWKEAPMMREKPILFSTPMVQAILEGRKTMTRRVCKDIADYDFKWGLDREPYLGDITLFEKVGLRKWDWVKHKNQWLYKLQNAVDGNKTYLLKCPYGQPGDKLWVREALKRIEWENGIDGIAYVADDEPAWDISRPCRWVWKNKTLPSMFMPRGLARIWLEVVSVRVERVQDITEEDAIAEGAAYFNPCKTDVGQNAFNAISARAKFISLWDSINKSRGYPFESNCWVWVIEFKRVEGGSHETE